MPQLEFFFDVSSPWTYLAFHNLRPLAQEAGVAITWRPILVGGIFNTMNKSVYESRANPVPAKAAYLAKDLADWARFANLPLKWPPTVFPVNSVKAMRGCLVAARTGKAEPMAEALFDIHWREDRDLSQDDVLSAACDRMGFDKSTFFAGIAEDAIKKQLRDNTDELMGRGGFGSPTIFVNGTDMYFGNDRLALVRDALRRTKLARSGAPNLPNHAGDPPL